MSAPVARTPRIPGGSVQGTRQQLEELDALLQRMLTLPVSPGDGFPAATTPPAQPPFPEEEWMPSPAHTPPPRPAPPSQQRGYPASYMVIETATPPFFDPNDAGLGPRKLSAEPRQPASPYSFPPPVPGGRHQLVEDTPHDPIAEAARAQLSMPDEGGEWVPLQSTWQPSAQTWKPLAETWEQTRGSTPPRPVMPEPPMMSSWRENVIPPPPPGYEELQRAASPPSSPVVAEETPPQVAAPPERTPLLLAPVVWFNKGFDLMLAPLGPVGRWFRGPTGRTVLGTVGLLCIAGAIGFGVLERFGWTR